MGAAKLGRFLQDLAALLLSFLLLPPMQLQAIHERATHPIESSHHAVISHAWIDCQLGIQKMCCVGRRQHPILPTPSSAMPRASLVSMESIRDSALICYLPSPAALISQSMQDPVVSQKYVLYMNNRTKLIPKIQYTTTHSPNNQHLSRQSVKKVKKGGFYSCHFSYHQS